MLYSLLALAGLAAAQNYSGGLPAGLTPPSTAGFLNPVVHVSTGGHAVCVSGDVPVYASTTKNLKFKLDIPANQSEVTNFFVEFITSGSPLMAQIMNGSQTVSATYNISATLCTPGTGLNSSVVQSLIHGIGFDQTYWDFAPGYSYVDIAAENGYPSFFYDRLGTGKSSKPDAINVVQAPLEVEIAHVLNQMLRNGSFAGTSFQHVVGTGHSFGSLITNAVTAQYPKDLDAAVLTGYSTNSSALGSFVAGLNLAIASENQPYRFSNLTNGYLVSSTAISNQIGFYRAPGFDPSILSLSEATKATVTFGELLTQGVVSGPAMNFTGPIAVVNGAEDLPFCAGNCTYPTNLAEAVKPMLYPMASNHSTTFLARNTGHGVNLHYSANEAFAFIQNFIKTAGF